jgi:PKD repeat protein
VADIAVDSSGNKWLATDGSGVVVLDSANTNWTVYHTGNSGLPDNFVHAVYLHGSEHWFGTLGGGAARLDTGSGGWEVLDTANSLLPDDDVLAIAIDDNDGQWFAAFDTGLTYHGALPASPPTLELDPRRSPAYRPGQAKSYYLWLDPDTYLWHLAWSGDGQDHTFAGTVVANAPIISATASYFEAGDSMTLLGGTLAITATEAISQDLVTFALDRQADQLTLNLKIDGAYRPFNIQLGELGELPSTAPFRLVPPQPAPPQVVIEADPDFEEGYLAFFSGILTDTDSPLDHQITWHMGDGAVLTGTLAPTHAYADEGLYQATLTITDVHHEVGSDSVAVTVTNVAPEVDFYNEPYRPEPGQELTFISSFYDPGLDDSHTHQWDFGDGLTQTVTSPPLGGTEGGVTVTHSYAATGTYDVTLTVTDNDGAAGVISYPVSIEPFGADFTGYPGVGLPPFTATFYDTSSGVVATRTWSFGDGSAPVITTTTSVDHLYDTPGVYDVSLTAAGPSPVSGQMRSDIITRPGYIIAVSPLTSGTIILEAEDYTRQLAGDGPTWLTRTGQLGYSGSSYVQAGPDVDVRFKADAIGLGSELQYDLGLTITGTYTVWLRGYAANAAGDSVYVGLNSQPLTNTFISEYPPGAWAWGHTLAETGQPATFTIDYPGVHTLNIWVREDGFSLDQIILTTDELFAPGD